MEKDLDLIAQGKFNSQEFLSSFYDNLEEASNKLLTQKSESTDKICPECGAKMLLRHGPYGDFYGCSKYPKCKHIERKN
jgi:ssDNA-binding Zn-finger/Zn-ribbon topoisomerase 1